MADEVGCMEIKVKREQLLHGLYRVQGVVESRARRRYDAAKTPFERVLECKAVRPMVMARLKALRERLDPFALARSVDVQLERIHSLAKHPGRAQLTAMSAARCG